MPPLDFPSSPSAGQTYAGPGGIQWAWDTQKWTSGASAAAVATVVRSNYVDNSGFSVNQRGYVSGTALGVGAFGHDRWKGGAAGGTYTFTAAPPSTTITITAGTLQQIIEGASVVGGNYMLSWTGTAQGRVGAGSYAASPVAVAGATAGANLTIEFNAGTLAQVKLEPGTVVTPWQAKPARDELSNCQRFYCIRSAHTVGGASVASNTFYLPYSFPVQMRGTPSVAFFMAGGGGYSGASAGNFTADGFSGLAVASGTTYIAIANWTASADL